MLDQFYPIQCFLSRCILLLNFLLALFLANLALPVTPKKKELNVYTNVKARQDNTSLHNYSFITLDTFLCIIQLKLCTFAGS